jgi:penicillin amidase
MMRLQGDNFNLKAAESIPLFLSLLDSSNLKPSEQEVFRALRSWDYFNNAGSVAAAYYEAWWDNLMPLTWDELEQGNVALESPTTYNTIRLIREKPDLSFFDIVKTPEKETAKEVVRKAFSLGVQDIEKWKEEHPTALTWADYKGSYIGHLLPPLKALSIPVKTGGNHDIVNAHSRTHGPSWRMIVSLEKTGVRTWATYPGGQSGNPGSLHYSDMLARWEKGNYFPLLFLHEIGEATERIVYTTTINAEKK